MTKVAVIGLGTMGPGIAATFHRAGLDVLAFDTDRAQRDKAAERCRIANDVLEKLGVPNKNHGQTIRVTGSLSDCVDGTELILETIPENLDLKIALFRELERMASTSATFASDTSGLPITMIQAGLKRPERVIGMHWSNPPHIIPMIEVIAGELTSASTTQWMCDLVRQIGHIPVVIKKDVPGFVENRVLYSVMRECLDLVADGVIDPQDLDTCVSWGIGYKLSVVGPMALLDMAGLDIYEAVASYLNKELSDRADVSVHVTDKVARGELGLKSGSGIYTYTKEEIDRLQSERARRLIAVRRALQA